MRISLAKWVILEVSSLSHALSARKKYARSEPARLSGKLSAVELAQPIASSPEMFLDLDEALQRLEKQDARKARVIEMRFFAGLTAEETAENLGVSVQTVRRDLRLGQAWLQREMTRVPRM